MGILVLVYIVLDLKKGGWRHLWTLPCRWKTLFRHVDLRQHHIRQRKRKHSNPERFWDLRRKDCQCIQVFRIQRQGTDKKFLSLDGMVEMWSLMMVEMWSLMIVEMDIDISIRNKSSSRVNVGTWKTNKGFEKAPNYNQTKIKPFYRVGNHSFLMII